MKYSTTHLQFLLDMYFHDISVYFCLVLKYKTKIHINKTCLYVYLIFNIYIKCNEKCYIFITYLLKDTPTHSV
jgi:hypothetical protein